MNYPIDLHSRLRVLEIQQSKLQEQVQGLIQDFGKDSCQAETRIMQMENRITFLEDIPKLEQVLQGAEKWESMLKNEVQTQLNQQEIQTLKTNLENLGKRFQDLKEMVHIINEDLLNVEEKLGINIY